MSANLTQSNLEENYRVHGVASLSIANSLVFPTSNYANPALTIVALGPRRADQVKRLLEDAA